MSDRIMSRPRMSRILTVLVLVSLCSCAPAEDERILGRWKSVTPEGFQFLEFGPDGLVAVGDHADRMTRGRYRFHRKKKIIVQIPAHSSFPGEFQVWQVTPSEDSLVTYREGSFGLAEGSRQFRRMDAR